MPGRQIVLNTHDEQNYGLRMTNKTSLALQSGLSQLLDSNTDGLETRLS